MDVSIIYVNYKTSRLIMDSIASVRKLVTGIDYEIIVVDNNSGDEIENVLDSDVIFIQSGGNIGFGRANNLGAKSATGKYLFLLNGDTILINNAIRTLYDYMENNSNVGVAGGNLYNAEGKPTHSYLKELPSIKNIFLWEILPYRMYLDKHNDNLYWNNSGAPLEVGYVTGADFMVRKDIYDIVGGFDEEFFMYCEESELCNRIYKQSYKIMSVPQAEIIHLEGASMVGNNVAFNPRRYEIMNGESQFLYYTKVYGKRSVKWYVRLTCLSLRLRMKKDSDNKEKIQIIKNAYKKWKVKRESKLD